MSALLQEQNGSIHILARLVSKTILTLVFISCICNYSYAHGTQVAYCVTTAGKIRVYIEHWHGNISPANVTNAPVTIRVTDGSTGAVTTYMIPPDGVVWDTPVGSLPDCKGPVNVISSCPGRANVYNDWAYWDFVPPACFVNLTIEVVAVTGSDSWYFDEACGALYPVSFTDSFIDCVPPSVTCPATVNANVNTSNCEAMIASGLEPDVLFDDCTANDDLVINYTVTGALVTSGSGFANGLTFPKGTSTITYTVSDEVPTTSTCSFDVVVTDNTDPVISCPADLDVECGGSSNVSSWLDSVTATDGCGISGITNDYTSSAASKGSSTVTFTATDNCGNTSTCAASINLTDTVDPIITCPSDITIECGNSNNDAIIDLWLDSATASDDCSANPTVTNNFVPVYANGCGPTGTRTVTWTADDGCGNTANCTAVITMEDTTPPEFLMKPQDMTVNCINNAGNTPQRNLWRNNDGGGMATDDCDTNVAWSWVLNTRTETCGYTWSEEYTFTITDDCGNSATAVATFTVIDDTPPILNLRADITQNCSVNNETNLMNYLTNYGSSSDPCSVNANIDISYVLYNTISGCGGTSTRTYLFTATDECGNTSTDFFTFEIVDNAVPTWSGLPGTLIVECGDPDTYSIIDDWMDDMAAATFDACGGTTSLSNNWNGTLTEGCNQNTTISFTLTDECGNERSFNRIIAVRDRINPVFLNCPSDMTVNVDVDQCGSNIVFSTPVAYDQCTAPLNVIQTLGPASGSPFPVGNTTVRFDVRDGCNRLARCQFVITVVDTDTPSINCPSNVEACTDQNRCDWRADDSVLPITMDNCNTRTPQVEITGATSLTRRNGTAQNRRFNLGTSTVCYYVTDVAGNESSCCFDVIVSDCQDPVITCPTDITVECDGAGNTTALNNWLAAVSATDRCDTDVSINSILHNSISGCGDTETLVYQFTATDDAGNEDICYASYTIEDTTDPMITTMAGDGVSDCDSADADLLDWLNTNGGAEATDICGAVSWSYDFVGGASTGCSGVPSLTVTFTATDDCGNTATTQAIFNVDDAVSPTITCPDDITLECGDAANDAVIDLWLQASSTDDNCSDVTVTNNFDAAFSGACAGTGNYNVTFTATDNCGNTSSCSASIIIEDTEAPYFIIQPKDLYLECDGAGNTAEINTWLAACGDGLSGDDCDTAPVCTNSLVSESNDCGLTGTKVYSFILTDACGNTTSINANVFIEDNTDPILNAPGDMTVQCDGSGNDADISSWLASATATDVCSDPVTIIPVLFNSISDCGEAMTATYIFTAIDACGNQSTALASMIIEDTTVPTITCPADLILECGASDNATQIAAWLNDTTVSDDCGDVTLSNNYGGGLPPNCGGIITVSFIATDDCGNTADCTTDIILQDNVIPDFVNCPTDLTVNVDVDNCGSNPIFSTPIAVDNCNVTVTQTMGLASGSTFPVGTTAIEFTATDECGNTQVCQFLLTVIDSDIPVINCPSNQVTACADPGSCTWTSSGIGPVSGQENCPNSTITYTITGATTASGNDDASGEVLNFGVSEICYTVSDASGNTDQCCFEVEVQDCESPDLVCPMNLTVECDGSGNTADLTAWLATASSTDDCDAAPVVSQMLSNDISGCGGSSTQTYEFIATDASGNTSVCYADFIIEDTTTPSVVDASDLDLVCDGSGNSGAITAWLNNLGGASANDVCSELSWTHDYTTGLSDLCGATGSVDVTFTVTDDCGNTATTLASITITDDTAPEISCPVDITLQCGDPINDAVISNWLLGVNASDDCSAVSIENNYADDIDPACGATETIIVTFTATDECDNSTTCQASISIIDNLSPEIISDPQDLVTDCTDSDLDTQLTNWLAAQGGGVATDECDPSPVWSNTALDIIPTCGTTTIQPYEFIITDDCGNTASFIASFITEDNTPPELMLPTDTTVQCDGAANESDLEDWLATVTATDECSNTVNTDYELYNTISACGGGNAAVYLFSATDECGNQSTGFAQFTIEDTTVPVITCPADLTLECGADDNDQQIAAWLNSATATDICSDVNVIANYPGTLPADCDGVLTVTFVATDDCGNVSTCTADILMDDTTDPTFVNCPPADITINVDVDNCDANPIFSTPIADDNCDVTVAQTGGPSSGTTFPLGSTAVEFTATDGCGNTALCQFNIVVVDSDVPSIFCPSTTLVQCTDPGNCTWLADDSVDPSASFENCDLTVTYAITGATTASGNDTAMGETLNLGTSEICYTITDNSGNSSDCCFKVIVEDCEDPMISCPAEMTVECGPTNAASLVTWLNSATATDNCDTDIVITTELYNSISDCGNTNTEIYLFTATDDFGNISTCLQSFIIEDTTAPVIDTDAADLIVECDGIGNTAEFLTWLENNGGIEDGDVSEICNNFDWFNNLSSVSFTANDPCDDDQGFYELDFWVEDDCGNVSNVITLQFIIEDTTAPDLDVPANITLECGAAINDPVIESWLNDASAEDVCDGSLLVENNYADVFAEDCGLTGVYTVTFSITDDCGNLTELDRTITIEDTTDPEITIEAVDLILECSDPGNAAAIADWEADFGSAEAIDDCSDEDLLWSILSMNTEAGCGDTEEITYVFQVTDNCGNTNTTTAKVIIEDNTAPELIVPVDQTEECASIVVSLADWIDESSSTDDCGTANIEAVLWNTISACGGGETEVYLFTATDECGNATTDFASYTIEDTTVPVAICPTDLILECGDASNDQKILNWLNAGIATDDCSDVIIEAETPGALPDACDGVLPVTFTATDACGNSSTCIANITMDDTTAPTFVNCPPADLTINVDVDLCSANPIFSTPVADDNCTVTVAQTAGLVSGAAFPVGTTAIEFTATDGCGNTAICQFNIVVVDSDIPTILCPSSTITKCTDPGSCVWTSTDEINPSANFENCENEITYDITGATTASGNDTASGEVLNLGTSTICYTITDVNDNSSTCCFEVVVEDCEAPQINCPAELSVECAANNMTQLTDWLALVTGSDNCDDDLSLSNQIYNSISGCGNTSTVTYLFTATDDFGNQTTCLSSFTIEDTTAPVIDTDAADVVVECDGTGNTDQFLIWLENNGNISDSDVAEFCNDYTWFNNLAEEGFNVNDPCADDLGYYEIDFWVDDECGNASNKITLRFTIEDTTAPSLDVPEDITLECNDAINDAVISSWLSLPSAEDDCAASLLVSNDYDDNFTEACGQTGTYTVRFTAVDNCGNQTTADRSIVIVDQTDPLITLRGTDLILECGDAGNASMIDDWEDDFAGAMATDDCSDEALVWMIVNEFPRPGCGASGATIYTFQVTDNCGNTATTTASVIINDTTDPELVPPVDQVEECMSIVVSLDDWIAEASSTDACGDVEIDAILWNTISGCGDTQTETYLFTATDECGNTSTAFAEYQIIDETDPVILAEAQEFIAECDGASNAIDILNWLNNNGFAIADDSCGDIEWSNDYGSLAGDCGSTGAITVTFTATDECGNSSTTEANFIINDTTAPFWEILPQNLEIECDGSEDPMGQITAWLNTAGGADVEDDCSFIVYMNDFDMIDLECQQEGGVDVVFTASDACGNMTTAVANLTITDDVPPEITSPAKELTVECDGDGNSAELDTWLSENGGATGSDACSDELTWDFALMDEIERCGNTGTFRFMFTLTDACGNVSNATIASFIIEDTTSPDLAIASTTNVECDGQGNELEFNEWLSSNGGATATDDCSNPLRWEYDLIRIEEQCGINNTQLYRFTVFDACDNSSSAEASFIIEDTTPAEIVGGADMNMEECEPGAQNYPDFDFWLADNAGATAADVCGDFVWTNDYHPDNWVYTCGNTRYVDVTFTTTDDCDNTDSVTYQFGIGDVTPPVFTNCPPPIIVDAPDSWCSAYANFSLPQAEDNCSANVTVTQIDDTGLTTGDLFPVGLTILVFEAVDECDNSSICEIKIIVNDFHTPPSITCPEDMQVETDPGVCSAVVNDIAPLTVEDNCPANMSVLFEILDASGNPLECGFDDASGTVFPAGVSEVVYTVCDQPLLLITEILQNGIIAGVEITNLGPASLDISCLDFVREGTAPESHNVPNGTVLAPGMVYTQNFTLIPFGVPAGYYISFVGTVIDGVAINGHTPVAFAFGNTIFGSSIFREMICDHDLADDFTASAECYPGSYDMINPTFPSVPDNGATTALQQAAPSKAQCSFNVEVLDSESPICVQYDTTRFELDMPLELVAGTCSSVMYSIPSGFTVADINVTDLVIDIPDAGTVTASLTSPTGTTVNLFSGICGSTADVDINFDDSATASYAAAACGPYGQGGSFRPRDAFKAFYDEDATGIWMLNIESSGIFDAQIISATLEILEEIPYAQGDVTIPNEAGACGASFTWNHPSLSDNCCVGVISVLYITDDNIAVPGAGTFPPGSEITEYFEVGTTTVQYLLEDANGNFSFCSFNVTVEDVEDPTPAGTVCEDMEYQLGPGECGVTMDAMMGGVIFNDNCGGMNMSFDPPMGHVMTEGEHIMTMTITDGNGNDISCNFVVTILPYEGGTGTLSCSNQINLSLGADCMKTITPDIMLAGSDYGCYDDFCVTLTDPWGVEIGNSEDGTNIVTEDHIGMNITVEICECDGGNCCWGYLLVEHKLIPEVVCPADTIISCNHSFDPDNTGMPIVMTCEQEVYFNYDDEFVNLGMCEDPAAMLVRTWYVTDESNNQIECVQNITIGSFNFGNIVYPPDTIITNEISCNDVVADPALTHPDNVGYPTIDGIPVYETGDGLCSHFWNWDDQLLMNCEGSYEYLRKWIIRDMCNPIEPGVNPIEYYQSVKVLDQTPPEFLECPVDISISNASNSCYATMDLADYMPEIIDICGSVQDTFVTVSLGTVIYTGETVLLANLDYGDHTVRIRAKDQCSNYSVCEFNVHVFDDVEPVPICKDDISVSLDNNGRAILMAEVFDKGSFDNCTDVKLQVARMTDNCGIPENTILGDYIEVCCADIDQEIMVMLRVWDDADKDGVYGSAGDLHNDCMIMVVVNDKSVPELICPPDIVLECSEDIDDLQVTGIPAIGSVCAQHNADYTDDYTNFTQCGTGSVIRTWTIVTSGDDIVCVQNIRIESPETFDEDNIIWPEDFEGYCDDILPSDRPVIDNTECDLVGINETADTFYFSGTGCYKILRNWRVIDWCQHNLDPNMGIWEHDQTLVVYDTIGPVIDSCMAVTINSFDADCELSQLTISNSATDNSCGSQNNLSWEYGINLDDDSDFEISGTANGDSVDVDLTNIPLGTFTVLWTAYDGCGNASSCSQEYLVRDSKAPNAYCIALSTAIMSTNGEVSLWATDFDLGSTDNCTAQEDLIVSFSDTSYVANMTFDCDDIPDGISNTVAVSIYVTDASGNVSQCETTLVLQDNGDACLDNGTDPQEGMVAGRVTSEDIIPLEDVEVGLMNHEFELDNSFMSDLDGNYVFTSLPMYSDYHLIAERDDQHLKGISTLDLVMIQRHILGLADLPSPYKIIAADVNDSGDITTIDVLELRKLILGIYDEFPQNESWRFVRKDYTFIDELQPFPYDEMIDLYNLSSSMMQNDFYAIKTGDVNGTYFDDFRGDNPVEFRTNDRLKLNYSVSSSSDGLLTFVEFSSSDFESLFGMQFGIEHNFDEFIEIKSGVLRLDERNIESHDDKLVLSWSEENMVSVDKEEVLFTLVFNKVKTDAAGEVYIDEDRLRAEAYQEENYNILSIELEERLALYTKNTLLQNEPNPFIDRTMIKFYLMDASDATLSIYDVNGRLLKKISGYFDEGLNAIEVDAKSLGIDGLLYYQVESKDWTDSKKMILIKQ